MQFGYPEFQQIVDLIKYIFSASRIIEAMDFNVNPCDNFFEYACGSWNRKNVIPDDRPNINTFRKLGDELQAALKCKVFKVLQHKITVSFRILHCYALSSIFYRCIHIVLFVSIIESTNESIVSPFPPCLLFLVP